MAGTKIIAGNTANKYELTDEQIGLGIEKDSPIVSDQVNSFLNLLSMQIDASKVTSQYDENVSYSVGDMVYIYHMGVIDGGFKNEQLLGNYKVNLGIGYYIKTKEGTLPPVDCTYVKLNNNKVYLDNKCINGSEWEFVDHSFSFKPTLTTFTGSNNGNNNRLNISFKGTPFNASSDFTGRVYFFGNGNRQGFSGCCFLNNKVSNTVYNIDSFSFYSTDTIYLSQQKFGQGIQITSSGNASKVSNLAINVTQTGVIPFFYYSYNYTSNILEFYKPKGQDNTTLVYSSSISAQDIYLANLIRPNVSYAYSGVVDNGDNYDTIIYNANFRNTNITLQAPDLSKLNSSSSYFDELDGYKIDIGNVKQDYTTDLIKYNSGTDTVVFSTPTSEYNNLFVELYIGDGSGGYTWLETLHAAGLSDGAPVGSDEYRQQALVNNAFYKRVYKQDLGVSFTDYAPVTII